MQPAISKVALIPSQPWVDIENPGKFYDDAIIDNILRNRQIMCGTNIA